MARIRNVKPEFFTSETIARLPWSARLTFIGLWTQCDNFGRARDNLRLIKGAVWPLDDVSLDDIETDLKAIETEGLIVRYEVDGKRYLACPTFEEHQYGYGKGNPKYPGPPGPGGGLEKSRHGLDEVRSGPEKVTGIQGSGVRDQGLGGRLDSAPSLRCAQHVDNSNPPNCGNCKEARLSFEAWERHSADTLVACRLCNSDGYRFRPGSGLLIEPFVPCNHQPVWEVS